MCTAQYVWAFISPENMRAVQMTRAVHDASSLVPTAVSSSHRTKNGALHVGGFDVRFTHDCTERLYPRFDHPVRRPSCMPVVLMHERRNSPSSAPLVFSATRARLIATVVPCSMLCTTCWIARSFAGTARIRQENLGVRSGEFCVGNLIASSYSG